MNIQLLLTGNELMVGDIVDSNSAMIAKSLKQIGANVSRKVTVADDLPMLTNEIRQISKQANVLIINGGLGPTIDDLTAQALALAADLPIETHSDALAHLKQWGAHRGQTLTEANLKQAELPQGCTVIPNPVGSAVGFSLPLNDCLIFCTPGVPKELKEMLHSQIIPALQPEYHSCLKIKRFSVFGIGESTLQEIINRHFPNWPSEIELGFRAASPLLELKLTCTSNVHTSQLELMTNQIKKLLGSHIIEEIGSQPQSLASIVLNLLTTRNETITTVESCTGGLIASLITEVSGSSAAFEAGYVTYSNQMKEAMVGVKGTTLAANGAVSEDVVREMALGAIAHSKANYAVAVSGIAGPTGGTKDKPVGTVWIAWGSAKKIQTQQMRINADRKYFQVAVAHRALDLTRRFILNDQSSPHYIEPLS